jgi:hypothetical protein
MSLSSIARAAVAAAVLLSAGISARAATVTYTIDPARAGLGLTGTVDGESIRGGQITEIAITDKFKADRTGSTIQFVNGEAGTVGTRNNLLPGDGGDPSTPARGNFSFTTSMIQGAIRGLRFHPVSTAAAPIVAGKFSSDSFEFAIDAGTLDYIYGNQMGSIDLTTLTPDEYLFNSATAQPSVSQSGDVETVTIPFKFSIFTSTDPLRSPNTTLTFNGNRAGPGAAAPVPEPAGLLLLPALGLMARRRRLA